MIQPTPTGDPRLLYVQRSRYDWPPGYFTRLIGQRIPFLDGDIVLTGLLTEARETDASIELTLWGLAPEEDVA